MSKTTKLTEAVKRGDGEITHVAVRRPAAGSLRGLKLIDVMAMDVNTMVKLLPRITDPALLPDEIEALHPADLMALSQEVFSFFVTPEQIADAE